MPLRAIKGAAIALATLGVAVLWLVASRAEVPTIAIGQAGATMNLAYVRIEGRCTRVPAYDSGTGTLGFWLSDGTGDLYVASYRSQTEALINQGTVPALGDEVSVAGTLRIRDDFHSLTVDLPEHVAISRADPVRRHIGGIGRKDRYQRVQVQGQVRRLAEPYQGLTLITLRDETGAIDLAVSDELIALSNATPDLEVGQSVEVTASVSLYGATPQLVPASTADITPLDQDVPVATGYFVGELAGAPLAQWVAVRGTVTRVAPFTAGAKLTLDDDTGVTTVLLWQSLVEGVPDLASGAQIRAQGELSQYAGELELIPEMATDIQVLAPAPAPAIASIRDLTVDGLGQVVTVAGTLGEPQGFSRGIKFPLSDETGTIILLLWQEVYEAAAGAGRLVSGAEVKATGRLDQYQGAFEIIPEADGLEVVE
jgi:DNA/RNA endonuclease YhcR with UshA esterase domain